MDEFGSLTGVVGGFLGGGVFPECVPTSGPDGCLVPTDPLASVVRGFLNEWNLDRPQTVGRFRADDVAELTPVRATEWLEQESGVGEATIIRIASRRSRSTELRIADALMSALGRTDLFHDGDPPTLPIYPNPSAPQHRRDACCGGSLTGDASW